MNRMKRQALRRRMLLAMYRCSNVKNRTDCCTPAHSRRGDHCHSDLLRCRGFRMQESKLEINRPERDQTKVQKGFGLNTSNDQGFCGLPTGVRPSWGSDGVADGLRPGVFHPRQSESRGRDGYLFFRNYCCCQCVPERGTSGDGKKANEVTKRPVATATGLYQLHQIMHIKQLQ